MDKITITKCTLEGPLLHQLVIFFGAHFSNLIICIENKLCKVRDMSFISKYLRPTLNFHIVKHYFYIKNTFYYVKSKHWARPLRDLEIIYNFAYLIFNTNNQVWEASTKENYKLVQNETL